MKRIVVLATVLAILGLLPASASATRSVSRAEARVAATSALLNYFGDFWRYSSEKSVWPERKISKSRWQVGFQFDYEPGEACYGEVVVWRGRAARIFSDVRPNSELSNTPCR